MYHNILIITSTISAIYVAVRSIQLHIRGEL